MMTHPPVPAPPANDDVEFEAAPPPPAPKPVPTVPVPFELWRPIPPTPKGELAPSPPQKEVLIVVRKPSSPAFPVMLMSPPVEMAAPAPPGTSAMVMAFCCAPAPPTPPGQTSPVAPNVVLLPNPPLAVAAAPAVPAIPQT